MTDNGPIDPRKEICNSIAQLIMYLREGPAVNEIFSYVQRLFLTNSKFELAFIFLQRSVITNFMLRHKDVKINSMELRSAPLILEKRASSASYETYIKSLV